MPLGSTPSGIDWCIKALHPSDPITEVRGIPDQSAIPSLFMNYQTVNTISPTAGATGTWETSIQLLPHPIAFGAHTKTDSTGTYGGEVLNAQLSGVTHAAKYASLLSEFSRWRLAYASVTIYQDGPDLANQGTVVACQKPVDPGFYNYAGHNLNGLYDDAFGAYHAFHLGEPDLPNYNASQAMPNAYFGRSRDGIYMPLKLTSTHQEWKTLKNSMYQCTNTTVEQNPATSSFLRMTIPFSVNEFVINNYPFTSLNDLHVWQNSPGTAVLSGQPTSDFCNQNWGDISFKNMAITTSLSCFWRFGFECQVVPTSVMAPHLKLSPQHDAGALEAYFHISRELKDAYPADFNDLGKIWSAIKSAASLLAPVVQALPYGNLVVGAGTAFGKVADRVVDAIAKAGEPTVGSTASQADREIARNAIANAPPQAPPMPDAPRSYNSARLRRARRALRQPDIQTAIAALRKPKLRIQRRQA